MKLIYSIILVLVLFGLASFKTNIYVNASASYNYILSKNELNRINDLAIDKLGASNYEVNILSSFNKANKYILVEGINSYLIFDRELDDYIEYSNTTNSIYCNMSDTIEKLYLAPTYYFAIENNTIIDLINDATCSVEEVQKYELYDRELAQRYLNNKDQHVKELKTKAEAKSSPTSTTYITDSYYFNNLKTNMGTNNIIHYNGSCSYVALGMLLSYYDSIVNDNVIAEIYDIGESKSFTTYNAINLSSYYESPGIDDTFHDYLINMGRSEGFTNNNEYTISLNEMDDLLDSYFSDLNLSINTHITDFFTDKIDFCKNAINSNNPVIIQIIGRDTSIDERELNHAVIGYGYNSTGIFVNFGWKGSFINVNINNYSIPRAFYIELEEEHLCSNNYIWSCNGCSGTICSCGVIDCNHQCRTISTYNSQSHKRTCDACSNYVLEDHTFVQVDTLLICCDCGYSRYIPHTHSFTYNPGQHNTHFVLCTICGFSKTEPCIGFDQIGERTRRIKCNQIIGGGLILLNKKKDEEYIVE